MSTELLSLYQKLIELRKHVGSLVKDKEGYGYDYVTGNQILAKVKDKMNELNLVLLPSACVGETYFTHNYTTINGVDKTDFIVMGEMSYTWVNADDPNEKLVVPWAYYGQQDDISKAYGSALTYSERYFWLKMLGLPTDEDDPDAKETNNKTTTGLKAPAAPKAAPKTTPQAAPQATPQATKPSQSEEAKKLFQPKGNKKISVPQQNRLFAKAGGNKDIVAALLAAHGLEHESDILMGEQYDKICDEAEAMAANQ